MRTLVALALSGLLVACGSSNEDTKPGGFVEKDRGAEAARLLTGPDWYRHAVFYEVFVRSFQDSDGDGIGDIPGLTSRLDELKSLGVDALWLMPIMPTPFVDSGYDVADYEDISPDYGTLSDFDTLLSEAHARGMRVIIDLVLNHTSDQHPWFVESRKDKTNPKADWYVWSDTDGDPNIGCGPANPTFGTDPWTFVPERNQYYFHRFYAGQPDLNYKNPEVIDATLNVARFWLDRGVDGFRCDVIALLVESATGCDMEPETVDYIKKLRAVLDEYPDRAMVAESSDFDTSAAYFGNGSDMFHMAFNFSYGYFWGVLFGGTSADPIRDRFQQVQSSYPPGAQDGLVIGSHDVPRAYDAGNGIDSRWRRAAFIQMTMPGTPYIYYGEELALRPGKDTVVDMRDRQRSPMLWDDSAGYGFTTGTPWLSFGADAQSTNLAVEQADPESNYGFYLSLLGLRRGREAFGTGSLEMLSSDNPSLLAYARASSDETYWVVLSMDENAELSETIAKKLEHTPKLMLGTGTLERDGDVTHVTLPEAGAAVFRVR